MVLWIEWFRCVCMLRTSCSRQAAFVKMVSSPCWIHHTSGSAWCHQFLSGQGLSIQHNTGLFLLFFHSSAVNLTSLLQVWVNLAKRLFTPVMAEGYMVFVADWDKGAKEGRRMSAVKSLHQGIHQQLKASLYHGTFFSCHCVTGRWGSPGHCFAVPPSVKDQRGSSASLRRSTESLLDKLATWFS